MTGLLQPAGARVQIDQTHMGRHATGIEPITRELFSPAALSPLPTDYVGAYGAHPHCSRPERDDAAPCFAAAQRHLRVSRVPAVALFLDRAT